MKFQYQWNSQLFLSHYDYFFIFLCLFFLLDISVLSINFFKKAREKELVFAVITGHTRIQGFSGDWYGGSTSD